MQIKHLPAFKAAHCEEALDRSLTPVCVYDIVCSGKLATKWHLTYSIIFALENVV